MELEPFQISDARPSTPSDWQPSNVDSQQEDNSSGMPSPVGHPLDSPSPSATTLTALEESLNDHLADHLIIDLTQPVMIDLTRQSVLDLITSSRAQSSISLGKKRKYQSSLSSTSPASSPSPFTGDWDGWHKDLDVSVALSGSRLDVLEDYDAVSS